MNIASYIEHYGLPLLAASLIIAASCVLLTFAAVVIRLGWWFIRMWK